MHFSASQHLKYFPSDVLSFLPLLHAEFLERGKSRESRELRGFVKDRGHNDLVLPSGADRFVDVLKANAAASLHHEKPTENTCGDHAKRSFWTREFHARGISLRNKKNPPLKKKNSAFGAFSVRNRTSTSRNMIVS